jgi:hypothetical protein
MLAGFAGRARLPALSAGFSLLLPHFSTLLFGLEACGRTLALLCLAAELLFLPLLQWFAYALVFSFDSPGIVGMS